MVKQTVEIVGLSELVNRFGDTSLIEEPLRELLQEAETTGRREAEKEIDGGTGIAVRSITGNVQPTSAIVFSVLPSDRAQSIEEGRPPGADPIEILAQIIRWKEAVGHPASGREIAREISTTGTRGKRFLAKTREKIEQIMPELVRKMARAVEQRWEAGRRGL